MLPAWLGLSAVARAAAPVKLILDTDMGGGACRDVDDVVALCTLHAMMDNGEVELLAVLQDTLPPPCAGAISVINHWYGRDEIPIGAYKGAGLSLCVELLLQVFCVKLGSPHALFKLVILLFECTHFFAVLSTALLRTSKSVL